MCNACATHVRTCACALQLSAAHEFVVVEGTGHCGVGSVLGWNNARVAATLGVDVVLVANGGIGSTFDDLARTCTCMAIYACVWVCVGGYPGPHDIYPGLACLACHCAQPDEYIRMSVPRLLPPPTATAPSQGSA